MACPISAHDLQSPAVTLQQSSRVVGTTVSLLHCFQGVAWESGNMLMGRCRSQSNTGVEGKQAETGAECRGKTDNGVIGIMSQKCRKNVAIMSE
jgi:hypothetical protein